MSDRPIPAPRKSRTNTTGNLTSSPGTDYGAGRYAAPVTPTLLNTSGGSGNHPLNQYTHQTSTPILHATGNYQPPVRPGQPSTIHARTPSVKKEYSGPHKVVSPQPFSHHNNSDSYTPSYTPRRDSQSSSRSSLSSEPISPLQLQQEDAEIEKKRETKLRLVHDIEGLTAQRDQLLQEIKDKTKEADELKHWAQEQEESLETLRMQENSLKTRIAQREQSLLLMDKISPARPVPSQAHDDVKELERIVTKRGHDLDEKELQLQDRETAIRQRELELQSEADILFQRKKELDLREYDLKNFSGHSQVPAGGERHFDISAHEERERDLQQRENVLFKREVSLNKREMELKAEGDRLEKWKKDVEHEDNRAQQNLKRAKEMMAEVNKIKQEALSASKAAAILDAERKDTQSTTEHSKGSDKYGATAITTAVCETKSGKSANEPDCVDDEMYARFVHMEIMKEMAEQDAVVAKQMSTTSTGAKSDVMESDAELAFQQQLEIMGIAPGSVDAEMVKKQILEELEKHKKNRESSSRDAEIAASVSGTE